MHSAIVRRCKSATFPGRLGVLGVKTITQKEARCFVLLCFAPAAAHKVDGTKTRNRLAPGSKQWAPPIFALEDIVAVLGVGTRPRTRRV